MEKRNNKELREWQEHLLNPFYYVDGKVPLYLKKPARPKLLGYFYIALTIMFNLAGILLLILLRDVDTLIFYSLFVIPTTLLLLAVGVRLIRRNKRI